MRHSKHCKPINYKCESHTYNCNIPHLLRVCYFFKAAAAAAAAAAVVMYGTKQLAGLWQPSCQPPHSW
jgi:hypothetical protein